MIKKYLFFFLLFFIPDVFAYDIGNNFYNNQSDNITYIKDFSDLNFYVNSTDYLSKLNIFSDVTTKYNEKTYTRLHTFYDDKGNVLKIQFSYYITHGLFGTSYSILRGTAVEFNDKTIVGTQEGHGYKDYIGHYSLFGVPSKSEITEEIIFTNYNVVVIKLYSILPINRQTTFQLPESFVITNFKLAENFEDVSYTNAYITTIDTTNDLFFIKLSIDSKYNSLNIVFKLMFVVLKGIMSIFKFFGLISNDYDFYTYQNTFLDVFTLIDFFINIIITLIRTIWVMGVVWTFTIAECSILIFSYVSDKDKDIITTLTKFFEYSKSFWVIMLINPLKWIFEHVIKIWS